MDGLSDEEIYRKHSEGLMRFAMGLVGRDDSSDVVSAAVLRSISSPKWSTVSNHRAYLYRAVLNEARKTHRDRQRRWARELRAATSGEIRQPEYRPEVLAAVKDLSLRQRAVIFFAYWETLTVPEIAEELTLTEGTVRRHLARARAKLRMALDD